MKVNGGERRARSLAEILPASLRESKRDRTRLPTLADRDQGHPYQRPINENASHVRHASRNLIAA